MLPTGFRTFHFVSFLYVFFFSFLFLCFVSFLTILFPFFCVSFFFVSFRCFSPCFLFVFFLSVSFRFFSFFSVSQFTGTPKSPQKVILWYIVNTRHHWIWLCFLPFQAMTFIRVKVTADRKGDNSPMLYRSRNVEMQIIRSMIRKLTDRHYLMTRLN